jgi:hypothetical protein
MTKRHGIRIREQEGNSDSLRDWLHEDHTTEYPYKTFAEAEAALDEAVMEYAVSVLEPQTGDPLDFDKATIYDEAGGGGYWFTITGDEGECSGRALVTTAVFDE